MAVQTRPVCRQRCGFERPHRAGRVAGVLILRIHSLDGHVEGNPTALQECVLHHGYYRSLQGTPGCSRVLQGTPRVLQVHSSVPKGATGYSPSPACTTPWANDGSIHESPALSSRRGDPCTPRRSLRSQRPSAPLIDFPRKIRSAKDARCEDTRAECRRRERACRKRERTRAHRVRVRVRVCVCESVVASGSARMHIVCVCVRVCV